MDNTGIGIFHIWGGACDVFLFPLFDRRIGDGLGPLFHDWTKCKIYMGISGSGQAFSDWRLKRGRKLSWKIPIFKYLINKFRTYSFDDHISAYQTLDFFHIHRHASFNCNCLFSKTLNINILINFFNYWIWFSDIVYII